MTTLTETVSDTTGLQPDMAFRDISSRSQSVKCDTQAERVSTFFAHHIARNPKDLLAHVQRINLAVDTQAPADLYGAMLDLYIALGQLGQPLRMAMLNQAAGMLKEEHKQLLTASIEAGIRARDVIADSSRSVLSGGFSGTDQLVDVERTNPETGNDPLRQAMASIECSDLDEARQILEDSIYSDQSSPAQQNLLLEIYRKTDDKKRFAALYATFEGDSNPAHADWLALAEHFKIKL